MNPILLVLTTFFLIPFTSSLFASEPSGTPILRIEAGMHISAIKQISVDAQERFLLTASDDKTLRLWDLKTGDLLKTYRVPIGDNLEGTLYAGTISPDGQWVVGGGWTGYEWEQSHSVYLFNRVTGKLIKRLYGLRYVITHLCFSPDGQYLAASLGDSGIRIWETQGWEQIFADIDYGDQSSYCVFDTQNRLLTSARDGYLRLYSLNNNNFMLTTRKKVPGVTKPPPYQRYPKGIAFSPSGDKIVAGFSNSKSVFMFDGNSLEFLFQVDTKDIPLSMHDFVVAWSPDGQRLCAGGTYSDGRHTLIRCWLEGGQGDHMDWPVSNDTITALYFLKNGELIYGTQDPMWGILDQTGHIRLWKSSPIADYRSTKDKLSLLLVSQEGTIVQFSLEPGENRPARFSLMEQQLVLNPAPDNALLPPDQTSLNITDWDGHHSSSPTLPKLNGITLSFPSIEGVVPETFSNALAISPDQSNFLLGSYCCLRLFDAQGQ